MECGVDAGIGAVAECLADGGFEAEIDFAQAVDIVAFEFAVVEAEVVEFGAEAVACRGVVEATPTESHAEIVDALFLFIVVGGIVDSGEVVKLAEVVAYRGVDDAAAELAVEVNAQAVVDDVLLFGVAECFAFVVGVVVEEVG